MYLLNAEQQPELAQDDFGLELEDLVFEDDKGPEMGNDHDDE